MKKLQLSNDQIRRIASILDKKADIPPPDWSEGAHYTGKPFPEKPGPDDLFNHMLESAKEWVEVYLNDGNTLEEAMVLAKDQTSAGKKVWEAIEKMYSEE